MTDDELEKAYSRLKALHTAFSALEGTQPPPEQIVEWARLTETLMAEVRARRPAAIKQLEEAQKRVPEGAQVGFDLEGEVYRLVLESRRHS